MLEIQDLNGGYGHAQVLSDVSFNVHKGELFGILGPNGSGKTTLLKMISGVLPYQQGDILLKDHSLNMYSAKQLAKVIAVLSQHTSEAFSYTVKETVSLGRYAHQKGFFKEWSKTDEEMVQKVMSWTGITAFQDHSIQLLSGGERQRVFLAQALAQEPEILLLDEPTNHLDLSYQKELLDLLRKWTREKGLTVVSIFHDLNLAGLYCDRLLLLENGRIHRFDTPNEVLKQETIQAVYKTKVIKQSHPKVPAPQMVLLPEINDVEWVEEKITEECVTVHKGYIDLKAPYSLRTMSSGVIGSGTGWHNTFVNRHVDKNYNCDNHREEMANFLKENGFDPSETVGMMTAVVTEDVVFRLYEEKDFSLLVVVTAGVGNAVDVSKSYENSFQVKPGTINTWLFVNGELTEEAFIQSIMTATEAKVKVLQDRGIKDANTGTIATGTSTDSILIAATQKGRSLEFAGTITPLGKLIGRGIYECTIEAIEKSNQRRASI
ncbi:adenosylcobinamide amidohydrolase [Bacillus sp. V3B]|uniref:adenosylcobinamide amidohydrolase n=1 Tax=Bacillus sp. V3B TaxID=2804915 RepID=UPI00210CCE34|nr:adenosylcobinamide amidohydrolase [Bacillus sp. V3B]MCQ6276937.1 adenosylcobinamide amidohydrolase [Bacillus sp. V3B]